MCHTNRDLQIWLRHIEFMVGVMISMPKPRIRENILMSVQALQKAIRLYLEEVPTANDMAKLLSRSESLRLNVESLRVQERCHSQESMLTLDELNCWKNHLVYMLGKVVIIRNPDDLAQHEHEHKHLRSYVVESISALQRELQMYIAGMSEGDRARFSLRVHDASSMLYYVSRMLSTV